MPGVGRRPSADTRGPARIRGPLCSAPRLGHGCRHRARRRWLNGRVSILSIQSSVAYGHVGNSAAVFPLQRLGVEVWPVHTVHFSNHTGYGEWRGPLLPADDVRAVIQGIEERGRLPRGRRGAVRLPGRRGHRRRHPRRGGPGQGRQPRRDLRVRPGHGQRQERLLRRTRPSPCCCASAWSRRPTSSRPTSSSSASSPARSRAPIEETLASVDAARDGPVDRAGRPASSDRTPRPTRSR